MNFTSIRSFFGKWKMGRNMPLFQNYTLSKEIPIYINPERTNLLSIVNSVPHLFLVLNTKAEMFSNMKIGVSDGTDTIDYEHKALDLLYKPNSLQKFNEFAREYLIQREVFGINFIHKLKNLNSYYSLKNLNGEQLKIYPTGKWLYQTKIEDIINRVEYHINNQDITIPLEELIINISYGDLFEFESKVKILQQVINNLYGSLKTRGAIIFDRGALGVLSVKSDINNMSVLTNAEKKKLEEKLIDNAGIFDDQKKIILSESNLTFSPFTFPAKDLMLNEGEIADFNTICGVFGMDSDLFPSVKGATFENKKNAEIKTYQSTLQPIADSFCDVLSEGVEVEKYFGKKLRYIATYNHLSIMQADKNIENEMKAAKIQTIINLNTQIAAGQISRDVAINILVNIMDFNVETAKKLIV